MCMKQCDARVSCKYDLSVSEHMFTRKSLFCYIEGVQMYFTGTYCDPLHGSIN